MDVVTTRDLEAVLGRWRSGELSASEVHAWAEKRFAMDDIETESAAVNEVLARLDTMDMNLTTVADVPLLLHSLVAPDYLAVLAALDRSVDISARQRELRQDPFYAPFCRQGSV